MTDWRGWQPPVGVCVCGRDLPDTSPSDWACGEPCQTAWMHHQANPEYPHPREIREAAESRAAARMGGPDRPVPDVPGPAGARYATSGGLVSEGTEIAVDGQLFVRVGAYWQPAGMWSPLRSSLAEQVQYRRWCPRCRQRRASADGPTQVQVCGECGHLWAGRPLVGVIETRGEPWPGIRLRLTDGISSTVLTFTEQEVTAAGDNMAERMLRCWMRMERRLCGGFSDADEPSERQLQRADRNRSWTGPGTPARTVQETAQ